MRIWTQLKKDMKYFKTSIAYFMFAFIVAPIILGLLYGALYEKMIDKSITLKPMNVYMVGQQEDTNMSIIDYMLSSKELSFIKKVNVEESDLEFMVKEDKTSLGIKEQMGEVLVINYGSDTIEKSIVNNLVMQVIPIISNKDIDNMTTDERKFLINEFMVMSRKDFTVTQEVATIKKLTSYQLMLVGVFTAMSLFIGITFASNFLKERENSMTKRLISINVNSRSIYISNLISVFVLSLITVGTYSIIAYGFVLKMKVSIISIAIACIIQAAFIAALYGLSIGLFHREQVYKNSITPIIMVIMILGGSFFPIDMFDNLKGIAYVMPNYNLLKLYEGILLGNGLMNLVKPIMILLIEIVVLTGVGALRFNVYKSN